VVDAIRVLLVDDSVPFRKGVADLLAAEPDFELVGEAGDGAEGLELARQLVPDVVLMDLSMPRMDGLEATRRIKAELPCVRIVVLTVSDERSLVGSVKSGAHVYLPKNVAPQALLDTIRKVARGEAAVSRAMAARLLEERAGDSGLTLRERKVLGLVAEGEADPKIAATLGIAESIVKNSLKNVLEKLYREHQAALGQESAASPGGGPRH
jgi:DNA-binding NarL/FixJ family response regulator